MDQHRKWVTRFAIIMVVMNLSVLYSNWRVIRVVKESTPISCLQVKNEIDAKLQP